MSATSPLRGSEYVSQKMMSWNPHIILGTVAGVPLLVYLVHNYRRWLALGRGGLPSNPIGYCVNLIMQIFARNDLRAPAPYTLESLEKTYGPWARGSYLLPAGALLPERLGSRPDVPSFVAPQRQTSDCATARMITRMETYMEAAVAANSEWLAMKLSRLEGPTHNAVWLANEVKEKPNFLKGTGGEILHVHSEGSTHMVLSLTDASRSIEMSWSQRHGLSGQLGHYIPWNYVLVYAPRSEAEFAVWKMLVQACIRFNIIAAGGSHAVIPDD